VLLAWALPVVGCIIQARTRSALLNAPTALLAALALAHASTYESAIRPLMPALRSNWLTVHVFACFLGYAGLAVAFFAAIGYLIAARAAVQPKTANSPEQWAGRGEGGRLAVLQESVGQAVTFGFFFLTIGIVTGSVWANVAWGTYWSWDPKETWALITWLIYAFFLHGRRVQGWEGKRSAWVSVVGFASVLFTYLGVSYLMSGLHAYVK
jgi:cytochrome c-type biogenesis protein CcsB